MASDVGPEEEGRPRPLGPRRLVVRLGAERRHPVAPLAPPGRPPGVRPALQEATALQVSHIGQQESKNSREPKSGSFGFSWH